MIGKGIIRGKSYSVIKRPKITQCCKRRKSSPFVFLLSLVILSCWGFYVLKVDLSVSTFACLNPIFYSEQSNHLQIQIKSVKRLLKTPQLLFIVHRIKSKHFSWPIRLSWSDSCSHCWPHLLLPSLTCWPLATLASSPVCGECHSISRSCVSHCPVWNVQLPDLLMPPS